MLGKGFAGMASTQQAGNDSSTALRLGLTCASAVVAETLTFPIDTTKTRLQLVTVPSKSPSSLQMAFGILKNEGLKSIYRGLSPALLRHCFYTPIRITTYEYLRSKISSSSSASSSPPLLFKALIGGLSGTLAQVVANPWDLVKVRMQGRSYSNDVKVRDAFVQIWQRGGLRGLYRGVVPNAQRAFLVNMGELSCYDHAKKWIVKNRVCGDNVYAHTMASMASGLCATTLSCPADVVKTRLMNDGHKSQYKGVVDCVVKTARREGGTALWKGFFPTWARLGPWQFLFWVSYEQFRSLVGISSF